MDRSAVRVYYMDGYHGGIRGHMPLGSWRDIVDQMKAHPEWRLSIDVEPISWDYFIERDPEAYEEFRDLLMQSGQRERIEIVAGSYAQPYGWITDGESNIRHLIMGREIIKKHFPQVTVDTYAVQEPCWTSALPQILRQLGYRRASLKDASTAWAGYSQGYPAETVEWTGPDGTGIPTVPRYSCEALSEENTYSTEAMLLPEGYAEKCLEAGIKHPVGMYYQDLGWGARPAMSGTDGVTPDYVEYSTPRDYFERVTEANRPVWQPGQEIFKGALPWGDQTMVRMARQVRRCEREMLDTERLCAAATLYGMERQEEKLKEAWGHLLMTQHHDGWICAGVWDGKGEEGWAFKTAAQVYAAEFIYDKLNREAFSCITGSFNCSTKPGCETIVVFHPLARKEKRMIRLDMTARMGTLGFEVYDGDRKLPCQAIPTRSHKDGSWNAGELLFLADLPALGVRSFTLRTLKEEPQDTPLVLVWKQENKFILENSFTAVRINPQKGGIIESYYDKKRNLELVPEGAAFNEFKGYFIKEGRFCSNTEQPAEAEIKQSGILEAVVSVQGSIADASYHMEYILRADSPGLDVKVAFTFQEKTYIGEHYEIKENQANDPHRSYHDGRFRLNAYFPVVFRQKNIDKDCAYDVCRSEQENTHFRTWHEIKHNTLVHWVDVSDDEQGLCIFSDHTTAYIHGQDTPLGLALAWGYDGGYWWGRRSLTGHHELQYRIMGHSGDWKTADLWHENEKFLHAPMCRRCSLAREQEISSIFAIRTAGVELGSFYTENGEYYVRVFNAGKEEDAEFELNQGMFAGMEETTPDGIPSGRYLAAEEDGEILKDRIPPFGIRTYRLMKKEPLM